MVSTRGAASGQPAKSRDGETASASTGTVKRNSAVRKEQNRNASRTYRERRRQRLALLEQLLEGQRTHAVAEDASLADPVAISTSDRHGDPQTATGLGTSNPSTYAQIVSAGPVQDVASDESVASISEDTIPDSLSPMLINDPVLNLVPARASTAPEAVPTLDPSLLASVNPITQATYADNTEPNVGSQVASALARPERYDHWDSSEITRSSTQEENQRDESLQAFFNGVQALCKPAISRVIYVQENSLFGAVIENTLALGVTSAAQLIFDTDGSSPFSKAWLQNKGSMPLSDIRARFTSTPKDLQPVDIQITFDHHVYLDVIPFPSFRDKALKALTCDPPLFDEDEMCMDMTSEGGLVVWGSQDNSQGMEACRSWDMRCWEPKPWFLRKYWYLAGGWDDEMWRAARWWHALRNERLGTRPPDIPELVL